MAESLWCCEYKTELGRFFLALLWKVVSYIFGEWWWWSGSCAFFLCTQNIYILFPLYILCYDEEINAFQLHIGIPCKKLGTNHRAYTLKYYIFICIVYTLSFSHILCFSSHHVIAQNPFSLFCFLRDLIVYCVFCFPFAIKK